MLEEASLVGRDNKSVESQDGINGLLFDTCERMQCLFGSVILNTDNGPQLVAAYCESNDTRTTASGNMNEVILSGEFSETLQGRDIIVIENPTSSFQQASNWELLNPENARSLVSIPLVDADRTLGACLLCTPTDKPTHLQEMPALERLRDILSMAVITRRRITKLEQELAHFRRLGNDPKQAHERQVLAESTLRASELKYRTLVESSPFCIKLIDSDGRLLSMNRAGLDMLGEADEKDIIGRHYLRAVRRTDQDRIAPILESALQGEIKTFDFQAAAGPYFRASLVPIRNDEGKVYRLLGVTEDITSQRKDEETRRRLEQRTQHAQKMEAIGQLAGGVAHDFNNFLTIILASSEVLLEELRESEAVGPHIVDGLAQIQAAGTKAAIVTKQLLTFSRNDKSDPELVDIVVAASEMHTLLRHLIGDSCVLDLDTCTGPAFVMANRGQIDQIVLNLVNNAADTMPKGGRIAMVVSLDTLQDSDLSCSPNLAPGEYVTLRVSDEGHGIEDEHLERIFEPFFTTKPQHGTGLGLSTVYGAVRRFGGCITVKTKVGQGSVFTVRLPRAGGTLKQEGTSAPSPVTPVDKKRTVLVCEDNEAVRMIATSALREQGHIVLEASSGSEALQVTGSNVNIDLLVTDVDMPGMSGSELADTLRTRHPQLPVLFMSGFAPELLDRGVTDTDVDFLPKPFGPKLLLERVSALFAK